MALKPITKYERYDCDTGPNRTFTPDDLASMREWDKVANAEFCRLDGYSINHQQAIKAYAMVLKGIPAYEALRMVRLQAKREAGDVL